MGWEVGILGHRSHISGKGRWLKSKLAQKLAERGAKKLTRRLKKINRRRYKKGGG